MRRVLITVALLAALLGGYVAAPAAAAAMVAPHVPCTSGPTHC
jgi:hypothetical protein